MKKKSNPFYQYKTCGGNTGFILMFEMRGTRMYSAYYITEQGVGVIKQQIKDIELIFDALNEDKQLDAAGIEKAKEWWINL